MKADLSRTDHNWEKWCAEDPTRNSHDDSNKEVIGLPINEREKFLQNRRKYFLKVNTGLTVTKFKIQEKNKRPFLFQRSCVSAVEYLATKVGLNAK